MQMLLLLYFLCIAFHSVSFQQCKFLKASELCFVKHKLLQWDCQVKVVRNGK